MTSLTISLKATDAKALKRVAHQEKRSEHDIAERAVHSYLALKQLTEAQAVGRGIARTLGIRTEHDVVKVFGN